MLDSMCAFASQISLAAEVCIEDCISSLSRSSVLCMSRLTSSYFCIAVPSNLHLSPIRDLTGPVLITILQEFSSSSNSPPFAGGGNSMVGVRSS